MRKILGTFAATALLLGMNSCSDDLIYSVPEGDLVQVTFTISPEMGAISRSDEGAGLVYYPDEAKGEYPQISDGSKAKRLIWAVYDNNGNLLPELGNNYKSTDGTNPGYGQVIEDVTTFPHKITITLVKGQEYTFAFWAQDAACTAFNTEDLRAVTVDYTSLANSNNNDELRDAFCKSETFTVTSAANQSRYIVLKRPFAQVNVGIPKDEYDALARSGVRIKKSRIHFENVATEFDVVANSTHGDDPTKRKAIDYSFDYIPAYYNYNVTTDGDIPTDEDLYAGRKGNRPKTQDLKIDLNHDGKIAPYGEKNEEGGRDETYHYLVMAYILPADRNDGTSTYSTTLDHVEFALQPEDEGQAELTMSLDNVPVQRNWRTNIFGNMFTSNVNLVIDLDPFYAGDYNYPEWERIYEGVTYNALEDCIYISNGAGLVWLSNATNGVWKSAQEFEEDTSHNYDATSNLKNSSELMLKAINANRPDNNKIVEWPKYGNFHFDGVTIKLDADIDLDNYANLFHKGSDKPYYFTPIGFGGDKEQNANLNGDDLQFFSGTFDGQNHTIYNLKTVRPVDEWDDHSMGLFSTVGRVATIKNVRLKNIDIEGNYRTAGIAANIYSTVPAWDGDDTQNFTLIDNCYVDGGIINVKTHRKGENYYDDANNVGGIVGQAYNAFTISNCFVRNITIRAYRKLSGILGQAGGDTGHGSRYVKGNKVYNVTLIADQYQEYGENNAENRSGYEIENFFWGAGNGTIQGEGNEQADNVIYAFTHPMEDGQRTTVISNEGDLSNPPLNIFPRLARYADLVLFKTSVLGGPSAYKLYTGNDEHYKGTPDTTSGLVGLWVSNITLDGATGENLLDESTITASGVDRDNDCVLFIKDNATVKNLTVRGADYAGQGICLYWSADSPEVTLENVLSYDAKKVLTDEGDNITGELTATGCNFRGYVYLTKTEATFDDTTFEGSTKYAVSTIDKFESTGEKVTFKNCTFIAPYEIEAPNSDFSNCYAIVKGDPNDKVEINGSCTITIDESGKVKVSPK